MSRRRDVSCISTRTSHYIQRVRRLIWPSFFLLLPLLPAVPAYAAGEHVICVDAPAGATCDETRATIPLAISLANSNATGTGRDRIWDGPA